MHLFPSSSKIKRTELHLRRLKLHKSPSSQGTMLALPVLYEEHATPILLAISKKLDFEQKAQVRFLCPYIIYYAFLNQKDFLHDKKRARSTLGPYCNRQG